MKSTRRDPIGATTSTLSWAIVPSLAVVELLVTASVLGVPSVAAVLVPAKYGLLVNLLFTCFCLPFVVIWQARFILRAVPIRSDGMRCYVCLVNLTLAGSGILLVIWLGAWGDKPLTDLPVAVLITVIAAFGLVLYRHSCPNHFLSKPFTLYLRRFSGFADQAGILSVLRATRSGDPVVFLLAPDKGLGFWDPYLIAFSGTNIRSPWHTAPIFLRSTDQGWETDVRRIAARATRIIIDISESSSSMAKEIEIARGDSTTAQVIWLASEAALQREGPLREMWSSVGPISVAYAVSWIRALPRMAFGFLGMFLTFTALLFVGKAGLFGVIFTAIASIPESLFSSLAWFGLVPTAAVRVMTIALLILPLWAFTFLKPLMSKKAELAISAFVRGRSFLELDQKEQR